MLLLVPPFNSDIIMDVVCPKAVLQNLPCQLLEFLSCHIGSNKEALVTALSPSGVAKVVTSLESAWSSMLRKAMLRSSLLITLPSETTFLEQ